jgi:hypothetical protein
MRRLRVVYFHVRSYEGGSPRLCRLRTRRLSPEEQALIMYLCIWDLWSPANIVALTVTKFNDILPYLYDVHQDSVWATHGFPSRYRVEECSRVRWAWVNSLIVVMNYGHSCGLHDLAFVVLLGFALERM